MDFLLALGELFTLVAYGQLLIEKHLMDSPDEDFLDRMFDFIVRDFSKFALSLYEHPNSSQAQMDQCLKMIRKPADNAARFERIWRTHVIAQAGAYEMNR